MNNGKVRIYELSKELNLDNREILAVCDQLSISVKSHSSTITEAEAAKIRSAAENPVNITTAAKLVPPRAAAKPIPSKPVTASKPANARPVKKQQVLEIRKNRPLTEPPRREQHSAAVTEVQEERFSLRRTSSSSKGYLESLSNVGSSSPIHMILVPGGTFVMGSPEDEPERPDNEGPQHEVTVSNFCMGRYPVTQAQWRFVAGLPQVKQELKPNPSNFEGDNRPVEQVSWNDAVEFCERLSVHTRRNYRLPSEAEWEYACRAGTKTPFYFGKTLTTELANYDGNYTYNDGPKGEYQEETTPVDQFGIANAFGLCDMHGNVREWCTDHWHGSYENAPVDGSAWLSERRQSRRVLRGGSWSDYPGRCRSAYRSGDNPGFTGSRVGFRAVCSAPRTL